MRIKLQIKTVNLCRIKLQMQIHLLWQQPNVANIYLFYLLSNCDVMYRKRPQFGSWLLFHYTPGYRRHFYRSYLQKLAHTKASRKLLDSLCIMKQNCWDHDNNHTLVLCGLHNCICLCKITSLQSCSAPKAQVMQQWPAAHFWTSHLNCL